MKDLSYNTLLSCLQLLFGFNCILILFRQSCMLLDCLLCNIHQFLLKHRQFCCRHFNHLKIVSYCHFIGSHSIYIYIWQYINKRGGNSWSYFLKIPSFKEFLTSQRLLNGKSQKLGIKVKSM